MSRESSVGDSDDVTLATEVDEKDAVAIVSAGAAEEGEEMEKEEKEIVHSIYNADSSLRIPEKVSMMYVKRPKFTFYMSWVVISAISVFVLANGWFDVQSVTNFDWYVSESIDSESEDALADARSKLDFSDTFSEPRTVPLPLVSLQVVYEWDDEERTDDIITAENVQRMCKFERVITDTDEYRKFCFLQSNPPLGGNSICESGGVSIAQMFYPGDAATTCELLDDVTFASIKETLFGSIPNFFWEARFADLALDDPSRVPKRSRSLIYIAGPLGSDTTEDGTSYPAIPDDMFSKTDPQLKEYNKFWQSAEEDLLEYLELENSFFRSAYDKGGAQLGGGLTVRYATDPLRELELERLVATDSVMVSGAVLFVGLVVYLHTRSLFVTVTGMFSILVSLPVALFIYKGIIGIDYFGDIHIVAIFVILGIGANDVFVFFDAFRHSEVSWTTLRGFPTPAIAKERNVYGTGDADTEVLIARVSYTFLRASGAVFNTSLTTFAAFMATGVSPIIPVAAFGYFAALAVMVNFLFTMTIYPAIATYRHFYVEKRGKPQDAESSKGDREDETEAETEAGDAAKTADLENVEAQTSKSSEMDAQVNVTETLEDKIFSRGYLPLMTKKLSINIGGKTRAIRYVPMITLVALSCLMVFMAINTFNLDPPNAIESAFSTTHMFQGLRSVFAFEFVGGSDFLTVPLTFGIVGINRGNFSKFNPNGYRGEAVFDPNFNITGSAEQEYLLDMCQNILKVPCLDLETSEPLDGCLGAEFVISSIQCTIADFHSWHDDTYPDGTRALLLGDEDSSLWLQRLAEFVEENEMYTQDIGFIDGELKFIVFPYKSTMKEFSAQKEKSPFFEVLYDMADKISDEAPLALKSIIQSSFDMTWTNTELGIVEGMFSGLSISGLVAFLVLLVATRSLTLAIFAILAIASICAGVLGTANLIGWTLGVSEAIAAVMVVGLSVDFTTHTGSMYMHAGHEGFKKRLQRFRYSALYMGPTVVAGAVTTGGSTTVMFLCQLNAFTKIATLVSLTMLLSLVYTFFFFLALCMLLGPEGNGNRFTNAVSALCRRK